MTLMMVVLMLVAFLHWINFRNEMVSSASRMVIARGRVGEGAHFLGRCLGVQTWHTNAQVMDIMGSYGSDPGSRPRSILVFSCLMESPAAMLGDLRAFLTLRPAVSVLPTGVAPLSLSSAALGACFSWPPHRPCAKRGTWGAGSRAPGLAPCSLSGSSFLSSWDFRLAFPACLDLVPLAVRSLSPEFTPCSSWAPSALAA